MIVGVGLPTRDRLLYRPSEEPLGADSSEMVATAGEGGGGRAATAVVTARRLGWPARFVGRVGDDAAGEAIAAELANEDVDVSLLERVIGARSAESIILVSPSGARCILFDRGTVEPSVLGAPLDAVLGNAAALLVEDGLSFPAPYVTAARARGIPVLLDLDWTPPSGAGPWPGNGALVVASAVYARVAKRSPEAALLELIESGATLAVITLGADGAIGTTGNGIHRAPAVPATVVDTTGAGDVYHGAFLAAYLETNDLPTAMDIAARAAALCCSAVGGRGALITREAVGLG